MTPFFTGRNGNEKLPEGIRPRGSEASATSTKDQQPSSLVRCELTNPTEVVIHLDQRRRLEPFSTKVMELSWQDLDDLQAHPSIEVVILQLEQFGEVR